MIEVFCFLKVYELIALVRTKDAFDKLLYNNFCMASFINVKKVYRELYNSPMNN